MAAVSGKLACPSLMKHQVPAHRETVPTYPVFNDPDHGHTGLGHCVLGIKGIECFNWLLVAL